MSTNRWLHASSLITIMALLPGCKSEAPPPTPEERGVPAMQLTSLAFTAGETIPKQHTGDGADQSPALQWSGAPANTKSFALIADDPDAPRGTWVHWVLFNLPPTTSELPGGVPPEKTLPSGARQGKNDFRNFGYGGPAPPPGKPHRYYFTLYALDMMLNLPEGATKQQVEEAMKGHILAEGQLMGKYGR